MTVCIFAVALIVMVLPSTGLTQSLAQSVAQSKDMLVGTWTLVSVSNVTALGDVKKDPYGPSPTGLLTYTLDGRMMAIAANDGRKPLALADWVVGPAEERAQAFSTFFAYAGRYTVAGDTVTHHVEVAWIQSWVNTDVVRLISKLPDDQISLRTPPFQQGGVQYAYQELVWKRVK